MKFFENKRNLLLIWFSVFIVLGISCLSDIIDWGFPTEIRVEPKEPKLRFLENDSLRPLIMPVNENLEIRGKPYLTVKHNSIIKFLNPDDIFDDPLNAFLLIAVGLIFLLRVKKLNPEKLFSQPAVTGIRWVGICFFMAGIIHYLRLRFINNYVLDVTDGKYHLQDFSFINGYMWSGILLTWLYRILKQAEQLQTEQELTV
jgi:hypothetical protein